MVADEKESNMVSLLLIFKLVTEIIIIIIIKQLVTRHNVNFSLKWKH